MDLLIIRKFKSVCDVDLRTVLDFSNVIEILLLLLEAHLYMLYLWYYKIGKMHIDTCTVNKPLFIVIITFTVNQTYKTL